MRLRPFPNIALLAVTVAAMFVTINETVLQTGALDGISLTEFLSDEYRIRFMRVPALDYQICDACVWLGGPRPCECEYYGDYVRIPRSSIHLNSLGFRGDEFSAKENGTFRIFAIGDSFTFGSGVEEDEAFPAVLEREMNRRFSRRRFEVLNLGEPGTSLDSHYHTFLAMEGLSPDLIVLQVHANDWFECDAMKKRIIGILEEENLSQDPDTLYTVSHANPWLFGKEERCSCVRDYLFRILDETRKTGISLVLIEMSYPSDACFDSQPGNYTSAGTVWLERKHMISREDSHPDKDGHERIAAMVLPKLMEAINETKPEVLREG